MKRRLCVADFKDETLSVPPDMTHKTISREPWKPGLGIWVLVGLAFCLPFGVGLFKQVRIRENLGHWAVSPKGVNPLQSRPEQLFPQHSQLVLTWRDSHLDDPRLERLAQRLNSHLDETGVRRGGLKQLERVDSPRQWLQQFSDAGVPLSDALKQIEGFLIGPGELRIRLTEQGREQEESFVRQLTEAASRDLHIQLHIAKPFDFVEPPGTTESEGAISSTSTTEEPSHPAQVPLPEMLISEDYDLRVRWDEMHTHPDQVDKFMKWVNTLSLPTVGAAEVGDAPVDECFLASGSPAALMLHLSPTGEADPGETLRRVREIAVSEGIPAKDLCLSGIPLIETALQQAAQNTVWNSTAGTLWYRRSPIGLSLIVLIGLTAWFVRNLIWTGLLSFVALSSLCITILIPAWDVPQIGLLPLIALVVVSSFAMILGLPWLHLERMFTAHQWPNASQQARLRAWFPGLLGTLCLVAGVLTLRTYSVPPIQEFGLCLVAGLIVVGMLVLYGLPLALSAIPTTECSESRGIRKDWVHLGRVFIKQRYVIVGSLAMLMICALVGLERVQVENLLLTSFPENSPLQQDTRYIEQRLCGTIPVENLIIFEQPALQEMTFQQRLDLVRTVSSRMKDLTEVSGAISLPDMIPASTEMSDPTAATGEKLSLLDKHKLRMKSDSFESVLRQRADFREWCQIETASNDAEVPVREFWKIAAQYRSRGTPEDLIDQVNSSCQSVTRYHPGVRHLATTPAVLSLGNLESLKDSAVVSLGMMTAICIAVLLILLHNPMAVGLTLIPIFLGCVVPIGISSWFSVSIGPMQLIALPVVLGINAFLTINLLAAFCHHQQEGRDRFTAAAEAYGDLAPVFCHVYIIVGASLGMLGFSDFGMVRQFGLSLLLFLGSSFLLNLILIPALSAGWIGICLEPRDQKVKKRAHSEPLGEIEVPEPALTGASLAQVAQAVEIHQHGRRRIDGGPKRK